MCIWNTEGQTIKFARSIADGQTFLLRWTWIEYLGYLLTREGIMPQPEKVSAILVTLPPKNLKGLNSFLGVISHYSKA